MQYKYNNDIIYKQIQTGLYYSFFNHLPYDWFIMSISSGSCSNLHFLSLCSHNLCSWCLSMCRRFRLLLCCQTSCCSLCPIAVSHHWRCTDNALADHRPADYRRQIIGRLPVVYLRTHRSNGTEFTKPCLKLNSIHSFTLSSLLCSVECWMFFVVLFTKTNNRPVPIVKWPIPIIGKLAVNRPIPIIRW